MAVIISSDVLDRIDDYAVALSRYPIPMERAHEKVDKLIATLNRLDTSLSIPPICVHKDLGQILDASGKPINKNLRRFNYADESGFQWAFACLFLEENETTTVIITKMMAASFVKESIEAVILPILEFNQRLSAIR